MTSKPCIGRPFSPFEWLFDSIFMEQNVVGVDATPQYQKIGTLWIVRELFEGATQILLRSSL